MGRVGLPELVEQPRGRIGWQRLPRSAAEAKTHESLGGAGVHCVVIRLQHVSECDEWSSKVAALRWLH
jgi:hypothetical protein